MPQLIFKGVAKEHVQALSASTVKQLAEIASSPEDYFTYEWIDSHYFMQGESVSLYPLIEIIQYDRGADVERAMAECLGVGLQQLGYEYYEIYFSTVQEGRYYMP